MILSDTEITDTIDWYSITVNSPRYDSRMTMACKELERGMLGYTVVLEFIDGRLEMINPNRPEMKTHIQISGDALETISARMTKLDVVAANMPGLLVSRIDIAIDIKMGSLDIDRLIREITEGNAVTPARKSHHIKSIGERGQTLYIGGRKSKVKARIYDKAAEQNVPGEWTRIEVQYRGKKATEVRRMLLAGETIPSIVQGFIDFPGCTEWRLCLSGSKAKVYAPEEKSNKTQAWLMQSVLPSLASEAYKDTGFQRAWEVAYASALIEEASKHYNRITS